MVMSFKRLAMIDSSKLFPSLYVSMSCFGHLSSCINLVKFPTLFYFIFPFFECIYSFSWGSIAEKPPHLLSVLYLFNLYRNGLSSSLGFKGLQCLSVNTYFNFAF